MDKCSYKLVSIDYKSIKLPVLYLKGEMEVDINYDTEYRMCFPETWLVVEEYGDISFWDSFEFFMEYELLEVYSMGYYQKDNPDRKIVIKNCDIGTE